MDHMFLRMCRLCLKTEDDLFPIFPENNNQIITLITDCTVLDVKKEDGFPQNLCKMCLDQLENFYIFREQCKETSIMLKTSYKQFARLERIFEHPYSKQSIADKKLLPFKITSLAFGSCSNNCILRKAIECFSNIDSKTEQVPQNEKRITRQRTVQKQRENANNIPEFNGNSECIQETEMRNMEDAPQISFETEIALDVKSEDDLKELEENYSCEEYSPSCEEPESNDIDDDYTEGYTVKRKKRRLLNSTKRNSINVPKSNSKLSTSEKLENCSDCDFQFESTEKLLIHRKQLHKRRYACHYCNKTFKSESIRKIHVRTHRPENETIQCEICKKKCRSNKALRAHKVTHSGVMKIKCTTCLKEFSSPANLRRHLMIHTNERPHMCHFCGMSFNQAVARDNHIMVKHSPEKVHRCKLCTMRFETSEQLEEHMEKHAQRSEEKNQQNHQLDPTNTPTLHCDSCNKDFSTHANLRQHMNWHIKPYLCNVCGKGYGNRHALKNHERTHTGEKPFECNICQKKFTMNVLLKSHMKSHAGESAKKFACPYCPKKFTLQSTMKTHTYTHTGERPFPCSMCDKTFSQNAHLRTHMYTHTGEKKHVCPECNKAFALKEGLRYHMMTHTGDTPFICGECGRGFYIPYKLKVHMLKSHGIEMPIEKK